ncbi:hypothetical protein MNBD_GAMMA09-1809 [hydrothermal vent metagenome]|uniref:SET domain-containing protein n=1 Tax=hydrothermal vent metagenome TaxID=652676 RepID=A0A3B0XIQ8_9ZZZZ
MNKPAYHVKPSSIHGKGLFAARDIKKGDVIGSIKYQPTDEDGLHVLWVNDNLSVRVDCDLKYINHNSKPNACYYDDLKVVALKHIRKGDEITHNYGDDWD